MRKWLAAAAFLSTALLLTLLTQIGGSVLAMALLLSHCVFRNRITSQQRRILTSAIFILLYLIVSLIVVPPVARHFDRVPLNCFANKDEPYGAASSFYCLFNRNYVRSDIRTTIETISQRLTARYPGTELTYLDTGFPLGSTVPMLPHLSHNDGRKVDFALFYAGNSKGGAWPIGYWAFNISPPSIANPCPGGGIMRWQMDWLQPLLPHALLDEDRTRALVTEILATGPQRTFLEPNLVEELDLKGRGIIFAGCHAARHDDHIHAQWR